LKEAARKAKVMYSSEMLVDFQLTSKTTELLITNAGEHQILQLKKECYLLGELSNPADKQHATGT
jgi:hypothetical protein